MKYLNKIIAYILILSLFLNMSMTVYGVEENKNIEVNMYEVPIVSNEDTESKVVMFYEIEGKYFLDIENIKELTRCNLSIDEETVTLTQGLREIVIEKATGYMTDSELVVQGNITFFEYDGKYLCEGIPMLKYLGATCRIKDDIKLEVLMPTYTIWEAIMPDYLDYYFDIGELYGGEDNVKFSLICDIIADVLDGVSGHGLMANGDKHLEDALYEILNVDMMKYESVKEIASAQNQKINEFLSSAVFGTSLDTADNMYDAVYEALDYYSKFYISAQNDILLDMMTQTDDLDYASELASQIKKQVYAQSATKANLKNVKKVQSFMDIGMLAFDTAVTSYSMMQYNDDTKNLFVRTINQEMFEYANYYDIGWNNVSDKISNTLKSTQSIVTNTAIDNVAGFAVEKVTEEGAKMALSAFTSKANIYTVAIQIGSFIASLINYKSNQAFSADMNAIWLSTVQYDIAMLASSLLVRESEDTKFTNVESLKKLKDIFTLYYRTTIAFSENISKSLEEFGGKNSQEWIDWFSSTKEKSVANYTAAYLYRITNCEVVPIVKYLELSDNVISADWIEKYKVEKTEEKQECLSRINYYNSEGKLIYYESYAYYDNGLLCSKTLHSVNYSSGSTSYSYIGDEYTFLYLYDEDGNLKETILDALTITEWYNRHTGEITLGYEYDKNGNSKKIVIYPKSESIEQEKFGVDLSKTEKIYGDAPVISTNLNNDWASLYLNEIFSQEEPTDATTGRFIYVDDNAEPELWLDYGYGYAGAEIFTTGNGNINKIHMSHGVAEWIKNGNLLLASGGHQGMYYDILYQIENGKFTLLVEGEYISKDAFNYEDYNYYLNGSEISKDEYEENLEKLFDTSNVVDINQNIYTYQQCKLLLQAIANKNNQDDAELIWSEFLKTGNYAVYTKDWDESLLEYVITDINLDMIPELLIQSITEAPFFNTWIFALENKEIVPVTEIYGYGQFRYSKNQNVVIGSPEWKPFGGTGYCPFYKLEGTKLEFVFEIIQDEGIFYYSDNVGTKEINEDERKQFFSDVNYFEWKRIQTLNPIEKSSKMDLSKYLGTDIYRFINMLGDMKKVNTSDGSIEYSNGTIIVAAGYNSNNISFISINDECDYSIKEIEVGMSFSDATGIAYENYGYILDNLSYYKMFKMNDGTYLSFHAEDEVRVDSIVLYIQE